NKGFAQAAVLGSVVASGVVSAQTAPSDPSTGIVSTLGTYATDVGLLAAAILAIFYGKKLVSYLKV
ncbi:MAG TPA: hypothetical protein VGN24_00240, partial [Rhodanobacter sp.]|nr:hypothetical protein [Rhodanobacter sp.]